MTPRTDRYRATLVTVRSNMAFEVPEGAECVAYQFEPLTGTATLVYASRIDEDEDDQGLTQEQVNAEVNARSASGSGDR